MTRNLGFKRIGYDLFTFADMRFSINRKSLASIEYQLNQTACNSFFLIPNLSFFVLGFNVDHSKLMRLSFYHVLSWFADIRNSKPNICQIHKDKKWCHLPSIFRRHLPSFNIVVSSNPNHMSWLQPRKGGLYFILSDNGNYDFDVKVRRCGFLGFVNDMIDCGCLELRRKRITHSISTFIL